MVSDERGLATWLAARDDAQLAQTLAAREVAAHASWDNFFDAAEALLDAAAVDRALTSLHRNALSHLAHGDDPDSTPHLELLALVDDTGTPYAAVTARVEALAATQPDAFRHITPADSFTPTDAQQTAAAAERAFEATGSLADVLLACLHSPITRTGAGSVSAADRKRLLDSGAIRSQEDLDDILIAAAAGGLAHAHDRVWTVTTRGEEWLEATTISRWSDIAVGIRASLPAGLRTAGGGFADFADWPALHPLDTDWPARAAQYRRIAERWGFVDASGAVPTWTTALREGRPLDPDELAQHLVAEIDQVYLQADLTAIAPGPLHPALDLRLRSIAERESRAQASTYRFTVDSLGAGMTEGETAASIRQFLTQLSLTGIPQPLDYLIESTAGRHGLVRVRDDNASERTRIESTDRAILETIAVDQALRPLGLLPDADALSSRVARDAVYWSLADARYPVVAVNSEGNPEPVRRRSVGAPAEPATAPLDVYARLIETLRNGHGTEGEAGWLERELEQAVRLRGEIEVTVRMPDGSERTLTLEATGLGGGRLRGRDRAADIERTLPVSSIANVVPLTR
ncbi:helicase-associated domain-containing protein [Microbacterium marmarense]|uniref:Helicase-associated domain-containing protein n=1 Tax=Microbacterium marmarense TaxID=3122051 RepID=A0ABU8LTB4_9MICO